MDWSTVQTIVENTSGYQIRLIPNHSRVYRGESIHLPDDKLISQHRILSNLKRKTSFDNLYISDLNTALFYAFASDTRDGEYGKVICLETMQDLRLLDMTCPDNFIRLKKQFAATLPQLGEPFGDVLLYAFDNGKKRHSFGEFDQRLDDWFINTVLPALQLDGWFCNSELTNATPEAMVYNYNNKIQRLDEEYRFSISTYEYILRTQGGQVVEQIPIGQLSGLLFKCVQWGGLAGVVRVQPSDNRSDQFMLQPPYQVTVLDNRPDN